MSELNLDHDSSRALHRIVRAVHDGECPRCHGVHGSDKMRFEEYEYRCGWRHVASSGWRCPSCGFQVTDEEAAEVMIIFAPFMERNLAIFEQWRQSRQPKEPA